MYRNVTPRLGQLRKINRKVADDLLADIEFLQWSAHENSFRIVFDLLERKYCDSATFSSSEQSELKDFFAYFREQWGPDSHVSGYVVFKFIHFYKNLLTQITGGMREGIPLELATTRA